MEFKLVTPPVPGDSGTTRESGPYSSSRVGSDWGVGWRGVRGTTNPRTQGRVFVGGPDPNEELRA